MSDEREAQRGETVRADIRANLACVRERIALAAERSGRTESDVTVVAVAKTRSADEIRAAYEAGVRHVGENRVAEAADKKPAADRPDLSWHMVGHLQSRKAKTAVDVFDLVHSVDSVKLAAKLDALAQARGKMLPVLIEINVSGETTKYGLPAADAGALEDTVGQIVALPHLVVEGLMTVAFVTSDPEETRPVFVGLRDLADSFRRRFPRGAWRHLSMGMTDDFWVAVEEGATMVRIGRAIFGPRG